jgi:hypothetical protein
VHKSEIESFLGEFQTLFGRFENVGISDFQRRIFLIHPKN